MPNQIVKGILLLFLLSNLNISLAREVELKTSSNLVATAQYDEGDEDAPLLIFIHGFLQTRDFSTVKRLSDAMHENGFSILAPNLTLGISKRNKSLECESIHLHSLQGDSREIDAWVNWAVDKGYDNIILIGHSAGSVNITAYMQNKLPPQLKKVILISLTYYGPNRPASYETENHYEKAMEMHKQNDSSLQNFALSYCKEYVTTADNFLSYYNWDETEILKSLSASTVPNHIIIGSKDDRIDENWRNSLKQISNEFIAIENANHFFDQTHEFDLLEAVENIIMDD